MFYWDSRAIVRFSMVRRHSSLDCLNSCTNDGMKHISNCKTHLQAAVTSLLVALLKTNGSDEGGYLN